MWRERRSTASFKIVAAGTTERNAVTGSQCGSQPDERLPTAVNEPGQARGDHASSRTDPDHAERLTGIYGSDAPCLLRAPNFRSLMGRH